MRIWFTIYDSFSMLLSFIFPLEPTVPSTVGFRRRCSSWDTDDVRLVGKVDPHILKYCQENEDTTFKVGSTIILNDEVRVLVVFCIFFSAM